MYVEESEAIQAAPSINSLAAIPFSRLENNIGAAEAAIREGIAGVKDQFKQRLIDEFLEKHDGGESGAYEGGFDFLDAEVDEHFDISTELYKAKNREIVQFIEAHRLKSKVWMFPQMMAEFGKLKLRKNATGKYSAKFLWIDNFKGNLNLIGMYRLCMYPSRSDLVKVQTDPAGRDYCALVPLIMSAFKRFQDVQYMEWDREELFAIVEPTLLEAMLVKELPKVSKAGVLATRTKCLTSNAGKVNSPITSYTLYMRQDEPLFVLPKLARIMMCQTWCAHPINRTKYMVVNPLDWDNKPPALVDSEVMDTSKPKWSPTRRAPKTFDEQMGW